MKKGIVVSDIHAGSSYGLHPPLFYDHHGIWVPQNIGQRYLWDCWLDWCHRVDEFEPDFCIINGDVIEGPQRREDGASVNLHSPDDQTNAAIEIVLPLKNALPAHCKLFFTQGTPYHVGNWNYQEEAIARTLGASKYQSLGSGDYCREVLWLEIEGVILEAAHHISGGTGFYRATAMDRELQWSAMSGKGPEKGVPKVALTIRSHVHNYNDVGHATKQGFTTPCWQLQTRYARKASVHRLHPDIGGVFIWVDGKKVGKRPCQFEPVIYDLPPAPVTSLEYPGPISGTDSNGK
jgi:hypothetical protein